jgi:hypothetical protein
MPGRSRPVQRTRMVLSPAAGGVPGWSSIGGSLPAGPQHPVPGALPGHRRRLPPMVTSNPALAELGGYPLARLQDLANDLRADGGPLADFAIGDPDEPTPPFIREALRDAVGPVSRYPTAAGQPALREAVAGWVRTRHGVEVDPDRHVLPSAGSKEAIFHLPLAVLDPHGPRRAVLWGDPGYPVYGRGALFAGGVSDPVTLTHDEGWKLDLGSLPSDRWPPRASRGSTTPTTPPAPWPTSTGTAQQVATARARPAAVLRRVLPGGLVRHARTERPRGLRRRPHRRARVRLAVEAVRHDRLPLRRDRRRPGAHHAPASAATQRGDRRAGLRPGRRDGGVARPDPRRRPPGGVRRQARRRARVPAGRRDRGVGVEATFYVWFRAPDGDDAAYAEALLRERIVASPGRAFGPGGPGGCGWRSCRPSKAAGRRSPAGRTRSTPAGSRAEP